MGGSAAECIARAQDALRWASLPLSDAHGTRAPDASDFVFSLSDARDTFRLGDAIGSRFELVGAAATPKERDGEVAQMQTAQSHASATPYITRIGKPVQRPPVRTYVMDSVNDARGLLLQMAQLSRSAANA